MSKSSTIYVCSNCDAQFPKWSGRCEVCGKWNSIQVVKSFVQASSKSKVQNDFANVPAVEPVLFKNIEGMDVDRIKTGISEFDRVVGGGIVPGSAVLIGGDPGIGKSTLILQIASRVSTNLKRIKADTSKNVLYISGEESAEQIKLRLDRLGIQSGDMQFLGETNIDVICATILKFKPILAVIDSIQTMYSEEAPSSAGSINQVRLCTNKLVQTAKTTKVPIFIIGHVTKEGAVAGPKTMEHLVDVVLYLEGEKYHAYRILRGVKNRFGSTNEAGVFEMQNKGLVEVKNPSGVFLEERRTGSSGSVVTTTIEGTRPFLIEIQALTTPTNFGYPRRTSSGIAFNRLQLLIAVLTKRARLRLDNQDVYVKITGGFKVQEPAIDLAICLAIASSFTGKIIDPKTVVFGEVGLSGELRSVNQAEKRIREAEKLGFKMVLAPDTENIKQETQMKVIKVNTINDAIKVILSRNK
ncbi:MAG: DNA repair protein RadA [Candidatus Jordarchaeaceae archaeon]